MFMSLQKLLNKMLLNIALFNKSLFNKVQFIQTKVDRFFRPESDDEVKRLQYFWTACGAVGLFILAYGLVTFLFYASPLQKTEESKPEELLIETALSKVDVYDAWRHKMETLLDKLSQRIEAVEKDPHEGDSQEDIQAEGVPQDSLSEEESLARNLNEETPFEEATQVGSSNQQNTEATQLSQLQDKVLQLEMKLAEVQSNPSSYAPFPGSQGGDNGSVHDTSVHGASSHDTSVYSTSAQTGGSVIQKVTLGLVDSSHHKVSNTVETTIPAGAFAKTVLLSGLDASSAMSAPSDPRPMLLRIIDHGTLPRRFQSDLKDCHCTAGAYGDLSSERVYARLEKLTCVTRKTGEIIELQVSGYVSGPDGKAGIRGVVASRDGQFLGRSLMGGIFSGLSNVANPQNRRAQVSPFAGAGGIPGAGSQIGGPSIGENFMSGMSTGATSALDRLSQYYIDRAEQLQPVIQIAAGQVVDIVFTEGAELRSGQCCSDAVLQKKETINQTEGH